MVAAVTRSGRFPPTIQNVLYAEVDVMSLPFSRDLDPVLEGRDGPVRPATTVTRDRVSFALGRA